MIWFAKDANGQWHLFYKKPILCWDEWRATGTVKIPADPPLYEDRLCFHKSLMPIETREISLSERVSKLEEQIQHINHDVNLLYDKLGCLF